MPFHAQYRVDLSSKKIVAKLNLVLHTFVMIQILYAVLPIPANEVLKRLPRGCLLTSRLLLQTIYYPCVGGISCGDLQLLGGVLALGTAVTTEADIVQAQRLATDCFALTAS